ELNFAERCDERMLAGYNAGDAVGLMWQAPNTVDFPATNMMGAPIALPNPIPAPPVNGYNFPYIIWTRASSNDLAKLGDDRIIFNNTFAFLYPSVAVNSRGDLGGTVSTGGGRKPDGTYYEPDQTAFIAPG